MGILEPATEEKNIAMSNLGQSKESLVLWTPFSYQ